MFVLSAFRFVGKTEFYARIDGNTDDIGVLETELQHSLINISSLTELSDTQSTVTSYLNAQKIGKFSQIVYLKFRFDENSEVVKSFLSCIGNSKIINMKSKIQRNCCPDIVIRTSQTKTIFSKNCSEKITPIFR